jgi:hypothetical protein
LSNSETSSGDELCSSTHFQCQKEGSHHSPPQRIALAKSSECISYKLAVLSFQCLHGSAPIHLSESLRRVCDRPSRHRLRSSTTPVLLVPSTRTLARERAFLIAAAQVWNSLPSDVTSSTSLSVFRRRLKTCLFSLSFPTV